jgi:hypothetical protein
LPPKPSSKPASKRNLILGVAGAASLAVAIAVFDRGESPPRATEPESAPAPVPDAPSPPAPIAASPGAPSPPASPSRRRVAARDAGAPLDESALMAGLHALGETDPALSLRLAAEGNARFPDSPDAPERAWIVVKSLVNLERFDEARVAGRLMVGKYPNDSWSLDVQRHLLSNPP